MNKINVFLVIVLMFFVSCASNNAQKEEDNKVITENKTTQNEVKVDVKTDEVKTEKKEEVIENKVDPTAVENVNIKEEVVKNETKTVSDECVYQDYKIKATVVKIEQTENSIKQRTFKNGYKGFEVIFKFKSNEKIEETSAKEIIDNNNYMFLLNNGLYPGSFYIHKYKIEENKEFDALLKVKKSGVCEQNYTVKIEGLNDEDYFESNKSKPEREMKPKKPVIYLYPEKDMKVSVKIESDKLSHTYPKYENGWEVFAKKDGMITNLKTNTEHYCLFWEGINTNAYSIDEGFVVKGDDSIKFLEEKLEILGLNRKEANEFIIYWLPQLEQNQLNLIKFVTEEYNNDYPLVISPKPDSIIRVFMIFKKIDAIDGTIKEQKLIPAKRKGFSVVEWGGSEIE